MGKLKKIIIGLILVLVVLLGASAFYVSVVLPKAGPTPDLQVKGTDAQITRGAYLFDHVAACAGCHTKREYTRVGHPLHMDEVAAGGNTFTQDMGIPGTLTAPNITPDKKTGIGGWTDGQIFHAITTGVTPNHTALFPLMPYLHYGATSKEDIEALIAYMHTLNGVENKVPKRHLLFPMNLIVNVIPHPVTLPDKAPDPSDAVAYGKYLVNFAACSDCHTRRVEGKPDAKMAFAGGAEFHMKGYGVIRAANITPDKETGIGDWTRDAFIARFRHEATRPDVGKPIKEGDKVTVMPWVEYAGMTNQDLGAIYDYLRTVTPVQNKVETFTPPQK